MRALPLLLAVAVAFAPLGVGQPDGEPQSSSTTTSSDGDKACPPPENASRQHMERCREVCRERPRECQRKPDDGNGTANPGKSNETDEANRPAVARWCADEDRREAAKAACQRLLEEFRDRAGERWIGFDADLDNLTFTNLRVQGKQVVDQLVLDVGGDEFEVERDGSVLELASDDAVLRIHDNPTGLLRFKGEAGHVVLTFPSDTTVYATTSGARIEYGQASVRQSGQLVADELEWLDTHTVVATGFFTFHVAAILVDHDLPRVVEAKERVQEAIEGRRVAAEVSLKRPDTAAESSITMATSDRGVEVLAYDDVDVLVEYGSLHDPATPIRVEVSAELDEGRTIVLHVEDGLLDNNDPKALLLRYFDVHPQADGSRIETEVLFAQASSLADVLDAGDDGGQPEYWIVEDADGLQVLVSVPHWSTHAITISSLGIDLPPRVAYGIILGVVASVAAGVALLRPRHDDDF